MKPEEHMFAANGIYSSYYWLDETRFYYKKRRGVVIDVAIGDDIVEEVNKKLSFT